MAARDYDNDSLSSWRDEASPDLGLSNQVGIGMGIIMAGTILIIKFNL